MRSRELPLTLDCISSLCDELDAQDEELAALRNAVRWRDAAKELPEVEGEYLIEDDEGE